MNVFDKPRYHERDIESAGTIDADGDTYQPDRVLDQMVGLVPEFDPDRDADHAEIADDLHHLPAQLAEKKEEVAEIDGVIAVTLRCSLVAAILKVAIAAIIEMYGSTRVMTNFGFAFPENVAFGIALAVGIFRLVAYLQDRRRVVVYLAIAMLVVVSIGMAGARLDAGGIASWDWSAAIITLLATIGPALFADGVIAALREAYPDIQRRRAAARELGGMRSRLEHSNARRKAIDVRAREQRELRIRALALYDATFTRRRAKTAQQPLFNESLRRI